MPHGKLSRGQGAIGKILQKLPVKQPSPGSLSLTVRSVRICLALVAGRLATLAVTTQAIL